jgi:hypothetical protein
VAQDAPEREIGVLKAIKRPLHLGGLFVNIARRRRFYMRVIAASDAITAINGNVAKIRVWSPQLGDNGPRSVDDVVIPTAFDGRKLTVDGRYNQRSSQPRT